MCPRWPLLYWAASQGTTLPKPPTGTGVHCTPRHSEGRDLGATHPGHWLPPVHTSVYPMGGGPDFSLPLGTWTPTFPPSSSAGAKTSSYELGEVVMDSCSSEGSHTTLNTKLLAIHLAGEDFPDFLARWDGGVPSSKDGFRCFAGLKPHICSRCRVPANWGQTLCTLLVDECSARVPWPAFVTEREAGEAAQRSLSLDLTSGLGERSRRKLNSAGIHHKLIWFQY